MEMAHRQMIRRRHARIGFCPHARASEALADLSTTLFFSSEMPTCLMSGEGEALRDKITNIIPFPTRVSRLTGVLPVKFPPDGR